MIGKMADDNETTNDGKKVDSENRSADADGEEEEELSDSQFDDPEGFVDDITDEGNWVYLVFPGRHFVALVEDGGNTCLSGNSQFHIRVA